MLTKKSISLIISFLTAFLFASAETPAPQASHEAVFSDHDLLRYSIAGVVILFVFLIAIIAQAIKVANKQYIEKWRAMKNNKTLGLLLLVFLIPLNSMAGSEGPNYSYEILNNWDLYLMLFIVVLLFIVVIVLVRVLFVLMGVRSSDLYSDATGIAKPKVPTLFQRLNNTVAIEDEESLDMQHNYDGIRELDNKVPNWWSWSFYAFIAFAFVYMYQMFVSESIPLQAKELATEYKKAEILKAEFLKKAGNNIDENNVKLLAANDITEGASIYAKNCVACHGDKGQGGVGPNMTDEYWIHKGGLKDIFYSVKYGWPEKGMKSWKEDLSPLQIAQVSSYLTTMKGTNPPNPKAPQGDLYTETTDSASANLPVVDSTKK